MEKEHHSKHLLSRRRTSATSNNTQHRVPASCNDLPKSVLQHVCGSSARLLDPKLSNLQARLFQVTQHTPPAPLPSSHLASTVVSNDQDPSSSDTSATHHNSNAAHRHNIVCRFPARQVMLQIRSGLTLITDTCQHKPVKILQTEQLSSDDRALYCASDAE